MQEAKIISEPTADTEKSAKDWQKKDQERKRPIAIKEYEKQKLEKEEEMEKRQSNQEIADMPEFQKWCNDQEIEPTKRQAGKHREEFEAHLLSLEEDTQLKEAA